MAGDMKKKYNIQLTKHIHEVSNRLALKEDEIKEANKRVTSLVETILIPQMKREDEYFKKMFQKVHYSGSYYENLRICKPNEFDLNLELRSKSKKEKFFQIFCDETPPGFVQIQHKSGDIIGKWIDKNGFVLQNGVFSWLQSVVDKALRNIIDPPWLKISRKTSGPAITLYVEYIPNGIFSVDLVPVFVFDDSEWMKPPVRQPIIRTQLALEWCVVPKPYNKSNNNDGYENTQTYWRISFYNQEKEILNNKNHLKNVLKVVKLLRDEEGWHDLSSYYIKTVYLWALEGNEVTYWNTGIGVLFMNMLSFLKDNLKIKQEIAFFWDRRHNLLSSVNGAEIAKIGNRLENILRNINNHIDDKKWLQNFFDTRFRGQARNLQFTEVTDELGAMQLVERPLALPQRNQLFTRRTSRKSTEYDESLATEQAQSVDWTRLSLGIGVLAVAGAFLFRANNNREQ